MLFRSVAVTPVVGEPIGNDRSLKLAYVVSLLIGAVGFISVAFIHNQYLLCVSYLLIGTAWAAMLALPFTLLTNAPTSSL